MWLIQQLKNCLPCMIKRNTFNPCKIGLVFVSPVKNMHCMCWQCVTVVIIGINIGNSELYWYYALWFSGFQSHYSGENNNFKEVHRHMFWFGEKNTWWNSYFIHMFWRQMQFVCSTGVSRLWNWSCQDITITCFYITVSIVMYIYCAL